MNIDQARQGLDEWAQGGRDAVFSMAEEFGAAREAVEEDPLRLLPLWEDFLSSLPYDDFDDDDWFWLQSQITAYVAYVLVRVHGGRWEVAGDESDPQDVKYVVTVTGWDGVDRRVDVFDLAYEELGHRPPVLMRMLGDAEVLAGVTVPED
ncbi:MAG: hypothetical protein QOE54_3494 [Streptosporangiaceae bacterium]|nr:hypothetical protein [Streptosporangiaceae bacterium]